MTSPIHGNPPPRRPRAAGPLAHAVHPGERPAHPHSPQVPDAEHAFFVEEFRGVTIVVSLPSLDADGAAALTRTVAGFAHGDTRLVVTVPDGEIADAVRSVVADAGARAAVLPAPTRWTQDDLATLWVAAADERVVVVVAEPAGVAETAGQVAARLRATKLVLTDPDGGWGEPPRSFVDLRRHREDFVAELRRRGDETLLPAAELALHHGAASVNLCRAGELEVELFTFDGAGSVLTLGHYLQLTDLRVDDLAAVERLVAQGVAAGILKPRTRAQVARIAVNGLGARVARTGHLAGVVGLETDAYGREGLGEVSGLVTVSEFSGAGAGELLVDGLVARAATLDLGAVFAVTVSDAAAAFFLRRGFHEVPRDAVPPAKWVGYDVDRLARARCFWRAVGPGPASASRG